MVTRVFEYLRATNDRYVNELVRKEKMEFLGEMAGTIIHDFKNPIMGVQLATELIRNEENESERLRWCDVIYQQTDRMVAMAQELLEFSQGQTTLKKEAVPVAHLFERFQMLNEAFIRQSGVEVRVDTDDSVIYADAGKMLRVFQNLAVNAIEAFGGKGGTVEFKTRRRDGQVVIRVRDNGPGIPQKIRDNFFEPFVTHGKKNGSGLGTSIVKQIVEAHEGSIMFDTETGRGTTFYIKLGEMRA
jgi:signal transduction histidine kinase